MKLGKQLKGNLQDYHSISSVGQRYRIIYLVKETEVVVIAVAVGIRREGDKKKNIYELMKKYVKIGLLGENDKNKDGFKTNRLKIVS